jgi:hypothetical protein
MISELRHWARDIVDGDDAIDNTTTTKTSKPNAK